MTHINVKPLLMFIVETQFGHDFLNILLDSVFYFFLIFAFRYMNEVVLVWVIKLYWFLKVN